MCSKIVIDMDIYIQQTHIYYSGYNELHLERALVTLIAYMTQTVSSRYTDVFVSFIFKIFLYFFHWCINVFKKVIFQMQVYINVQTLYPLLCLSPFLY